MIEEKYKKIIKQNLAGIKKNGEECKRKKTRYVLPVSWNQLIEFDEKKLRENMMHTLKLNRDAPDWAKDLEESGKNKDPSKDQFPLPLFYNRKNNIL